MDGEISARYFRNVETQTEALAAHQRALGCHRRPVFVVLICGFVLMAIPIMLILQPQGPAIVRRNSAISLAVTITLMGWCLTGL